MSAEDNALLLEQKTADEISPTPVDQTAETPMIDEQQPAPTGEVEMEQPATESEPQLESEPVTDETKAASPEPPTVLPGASEPPSYDDSVQPREASPSKTQLEEPTEEAPKQEEKPAPVVVMREPSPEPPKTEKQKKKPKHEEEMTPVDDIDQQQSGYVNPSYQQEPEERPQKYPRQPDIKHEPKRRRQSEEEPTSSSSSPSFGSKLIGGARSLFGSKEKDPESGKTTTINMAESEEKREPREQYDNLFQYLLACIGFAVGLGNVWRFPKVALENGGGAFIIPWVIVIIIQGIPLMMVELVVGQRFRGGPMHSYGRMNKFCWGVGASMFFCSLYISLFYNSILSYAFMYFFNSFTKELPWLSCSVENMNNPDCTRNPAKFYFENSIVNAAPDLETGSGVVWPLYFATLVAWFVVFLAMLVGVQSVGKVIYFTALYPYLMLTILFFIGVTADGAEHGLEYLFDPDWSKLGDFRVWQAASEQVFFSASLSFGGLIAMASYMPVKNNTFRDSILIVVVNSCTSMFAALGIFSIKGHMAKDEYTRCQNNEIVGCDKTMEIRDYVSEDDASTGLVFIAMAKALDIIDNTEYGASVLSMMFYLMIITLGMDSAFGSLEGYLSILKDLGVMRRFGYKWTLFFCCFASGLFAMLFSSVHGSFFIDIFDKYGCVLVLVFIGLFEFISVGWIYGFNNFCRDFKLLTDIRLYFPFMILIKYIGPLSIMVTLVGQFVLEGTDDTFLTYLDDNTEYPWWAKMIAMLLFLSAVIWFPLGILATCYINRVRKTFDWGEVDFDYDELRSQVKPSENPRWQQIVFGLKEYDYPENIEMIEGANKTLANKFPNV